MRSSIILSLVSAVATAAASDATVVTNNPAGAVYTATLPANAFDTALYPNGGNVKGSVSAVSSPDGTGVMFQVKFSGIPSEGGPFTYHIHEYAVPADGNCTATGGHLDPFMAGDATACDSSKPASCQVGDLAGKYGKVTSDPFSATYTDDYASLNSGLGSFLGNRSIVFHTSDKTRVTCANFVAVSSGSGSSCSSSGSGAASPSGTGLPIFASTRAGMMPTARSSAAGGSNATATRSTPSASSSVVTAGGNANAPALVLAVGAAAMAYAM